MEKKQEKLPKSVKLDGIEFIVPEFYQTYFDIVNKAADAIAEVQEFQRIIGMRYSDKKVFITIAHQPEKFVYAVHRWEESKAWLGASKTSLTASTTNS